MGLINKLFGKPAVLNPNHIYAPLAGKAVPIGQLPDPTLAEGLLGRGIAIIPSDGKVCAPFSGTVTTIFDTCHAMCLTSDSGIEVYIEVGMDTIHLNGEPFTVKCQKGQKIQKGDVLLVADLDAIKARGLNTISAVLVSNDDEYPTFHTAAGKTVTHNDVVIEVGK